MRLCFFVNVRKARGLRVAGGIWMGRIEGFGCKGSGGVLERIGWTGVPKAGEEEGMGSGFAGGCRERKIGAVRF